MPYLPDLDRNVFENLCHGIHDFNESELARIHHAAEEVRAAIQSANEREQKRLRAGVS